MKKILNIIIRIFNTLKKAYNFNILKKDYNDFQSRNAWGKSRIKDAWHPFALKVTWPVVILLIFLFPIIFNSGDSTSNNKEKISEEKYIKKTGCEHFWQQCKDNEEFMNENDSIQHKIVVACKYAANDLAKYGKPKWPWIAFGTYYNNDSIKKKRQITLVENNVQFSNGFGAMVNSEVYCTYDLMNEKIIDINIGSKF